MKPFTVIDAPQRSNEWFAARCGRLTSSCADLLFKEGRKKGTESVQRRDLRIRLALERVTGVPMDDDDAKSKDMQRGIDREADARLAYEAACGVLVEQVGFISHNTLLVGSSPDGVADVTAEGIEGIVELKCPKSATHIEYLRTKAIPDEYLAQIRHHVWVSGAQWCDFVSFDDRMPAHLQLVVYHVTREALELSAYEAAVHAFLKEVDAEVEALKALRAPEQAVA